MSSFNLIDHEMKVALIDQLNWFEELLCEVIQDKQGELEAQCETGEAYPDEIIETEDGKQFIVYPENAAPELDERRGEVRDLLDRLRGA